MSFHVGILSIPDEYVKTWILQSIVPLATHHHFAALFLETEEAIREDRALCGSRVTTLSYGELGSIERSFCCCWVCVDSNLGK